VAGEILDCYRGKQDMLYLYQAGILKDLTASAQELGYGPDATWEAIVPDLMVKDKQYGFPRNVSVVMYWVNKDTFDKYGIDPPSGPWTWEDFERIGREFVAKANADNPSPRRFFAVPDPWYGLVHPTILLRSTELDLFNETLTAVTTRDERFAFVLRKIHQWMYVDRLIPSNADSASFSGSAGFGGAYLHLFKEGNFGLFMMGRYAVLQLREFEPINLSVVEPPHEKYRNTVIFAGVPTIFRNAPNADLAEYFLAYMASEEYNMIIVNDGDALPPNPIYTQTEEFLRPAAYPNEWGCHEAFSQAAADIAITHSNSPYVLPVVVNTLLGKYYDLFLNGLISAEEAGVEFAGEIERALEENLAKRPVLAREFEEQVQIQQQIDALKAAGQPIPREWVTNPFYLKYYEDRGLLK
jgi:multiple sugar transport system substrate-binding protein